MNQEENKCDFCGQVKPVGRVYVYAGNKEKILENDIGGGIAWGLFWIGLFYMLTNASIEKLNQLF